MMNNFDYMTPTRLIFGKDVVNQLPEVMSAIGKRVLLAYGGGSIKRMGLYDKVKELMKDFEVYELSGIEPNPRYNPSVLDGVRICKEKNIEVILAVGGGWQPCPSWTSSPWRRQEANMTAPASSPAPRPMTKWDILTRISIPSALSWTPLIPLR